MKKYSIVKLLQLILVMVLISIFSFAVIYIAPGDISTMYITPQMTEQQKEEVRETLGVNKSLPEQYFSWAKKAIKGDFGISYANKQSVKAQMLKRLPATMLLMGSSLILSVVLAIPLGLWAGYKKNTWLDHLISGVSYVGMSVPPFWMGMVLIIVLSGKLHLLPSSGMHTIGQNSMPDTIKHMIMPCITLCLTNLAIYIRYVRANTIGQLNEEYVLAAKAKGTSGSRLLFRHILKNTLLPIITLLGMGLADVVCGSFIIETVFGWPGIGTLVMGAIGTRDYPVIMAFVMMSGFVLVIGNFLADVLYAYADPRIKRKGGAK